MQHHAYKGSNFMHCPKRKASIFLGLIVILFSVQDGFSQKRPCTDVEARRALTQSDTLRSWGVLCASFHRYRHCDDGGIGEGYSESVARILVDHWNTLPQLAQLEEKDAGFRAFVLKHLDATLNMDDVEKVKRNAKTRCPTGLRTVCNELAKQADTALREASSP
jgi:hypothetical protein